MSLTSSRSESPLASNRWQYDVESILAIRKSRKDSTRKECLVKFKPLSHRKLKWKDEDEVISDFSSRVPYKKAKDKEVAESSVETADFIDNDYFHVDRIIGVRTDEWECSDESDEEIESERSARIKQLYKEHSGTMVTRYLVKWRSLGYASCTWERPETIVDIVPGGEGYLTGLQLLNRYKEMHVSVFNQVDLEANSNSSKKFIVKPNKVKSDSSTIENENCYTLNYITQYMLNANGNHSIKSPKKLVKKSPKRSVPSEDEDTVDSDADEVSSSKKKSKAGEVILGKGNSITSYYDNAKKILWKRLQSSNVELIQLDNYDTSDTVSANELVVPIDMLSNSYCNGMQLRDYQLQGIKWLLYQYCSNRGSILGDEMGLGKTMQALTFAETLRQYHCVTSIPRPVTTTGKINYSEFAGCNLKPVLIVAPLSTLLNWQKEINLYTRANCAVFHGTVEDRDQFEEFEFVEVKDPKAGKHSRFQYLPKFHYLITSYEMVMEESYLLRKIPYSVVIVDEGHRLKNKHAQARTALLALQCDHRLILSGTPIQNNVMELFSLLNFIEPEEFSKEEQFLTKYISLLPEQHSLVTAAKAAEAEGDKPASNKLSVKEAVDSLQSLLKKYLLRREKADVELSIPDKIETIIHVELTMAQKRYYRALLEKNRKYLCRGMDSKNFKLGNILMELRKTCNHPFILNGGKESILEEFDAAENVQAALSSTGKPAVDLALLEDPLIASSGKFVLLHKLLPKLFREKSKCLIFSQFVKTLDVIQEYLLNYHGAVFERIDGNIGAADRQAAINRFNKTKAIDPESNAYTDNKSMVFLLTTRSGGVGINLQAANTVIIFDSDWNPHQDLQAVSRAHRLGQQNEVKVYRLLSKNSVESVLFDRAMTKLKLSEMILRGSSSANSDNESIDTNVDGSSGGRSKDKEKDAIMAEILKSGTISILQDEDAAAESASRTFMERSIDSILETEVDNVKYIEGSGYTLATDTNSKSAATSTSRSMFAKAEFVPNKEAALENSTVEVSDANFWNKALPKEKTKIGKLLVYFQNLFANDLSASPTKELLKKFQSSMRKAISYAEPVYKDRISGELSHDDMDDVMELLTLLLQYNMKKEFPGNSERELVPWYTVYSTWVIPQHIDRIRTLHEGILRPKRRRITISDKARFANSEVSSKESDSSFEDGSGDSSSDESDTQESAKKIELPNPVVSSNNNISSKIPPVSDMLLVQTIPESDMFPCIPNNTLALPETIEAMKAQLSNLIEVLFSTRSADECKMLTARIFAKLDVNVRKSLYLHAYPEVQSMILSHLDANRTSGMKFASSDELTRLYVKRVMDFAVVIDQRFNSELYESLGRFNPYPACFELNDALFEIGSDASMLCISTIGTVLSMTAWFYRPHSVNVEWQILGVKRWRMLTVAQKKLMYRRINPVVRTPLIELPFFSVEPLQTRDGKKVNLIPEYLLFDYMPLRPENVPAGSTMHKNLCLKIFKMLVIFVPVTSVTSNFLLKYCEKIYAKLSPESFISLCMHAYPDFYKNAFRKVSQRPGVAVAATAANINRTYAIQLFSLIFKDTASFTSELSYDGICKYTDQLPDRKSMNNTDAMDIICLNKIVQCLSFGSVCEPNEQSWINWNPIAAQFWRKLDEAAKMRFYALIDPSAIPIILKQSANSAKAAKSLKDVNKSPQVTENALVAPVPVSTNGAILATQTAVAETKPNSVPISVPVTTVPAVASNTLSKTSIPTTNTSSAIPAKDDKETGQDNFEENNINNQDDAMDVDDGNNSLENDGNNEVDGDIATNAYRIGTIVWVFTANGHWWPGYVCNPQLFELSKLIDGEAKSLVIFLYALPHAFNIMIVKANKKIKRYNDIMMRSKFLAQSIDPLFKDKFALAVKLADNEMTLRMEDRIEWKSYNNPTKVASTVTSVTPNAKANGMNRNVSSVRVTGMITPTASKGAESSTSSSNIDSSLNVHTVTPNVTADNTPHETGAVSKRSIDIIEIDSNPSSEEKPTKIPKYDLNPIPIVGMNKRSNSSSNLTSVSAAILHLERLESANVPANVPAASLGSDKSHTIAKVKVIKDVIESNASNSNSGVYIVEKLIGEKMQYKRKYFHVLWKGFPLADATWEPRMELIKTIPEIVKEYERAKTVMNMQTILALPSHHSKDSDSDVSEGSIAMMDPETVLTSSAPPTISTSPIRASKVPAMAISPAKLAKVPMKSVTAGKVPVEPVAANPVATPLPLVPEVITPAKLTVTPSAHGANTASSVTKTPNVPKNTTLSSTTSTPTSSTPAVIADVTLGAVPNTIIAGGYDNASKTYFIYYYLKFSLPVGQQSASLGLRLCPDDTAIIRGTLIHRPELTLDITEDYFYQFNNTNIEKMSLKAMSNMVTSQPFPKQFILKKHFKSRIDATKWTEMYLNST